MDLVQSQNSLLARSTDFPRFMGQPFPAVIAATGPNAAERFLEFFLAHISNPNTRRAYGRAVLKFLNWLEEKHIELHNVRPLHVAAYVEGLKGTLAAPSVKQELSAIGELFDFLVTGQDVPLNPAASVKGPRYSIKKGKTIAPTAEQVRELLDSIDTDDIVGLRDRAIIASLFFSFARVDALVKMRVEDYFPRGKRWWFRLHEKRGKEHEMPVHHLSEQYLDEYLRAAGILADADAKTPLFRSAPRRSKTLTPNPLAQSNVYRMIQRRALAAGIADKIGCHSFRAAGITVYLQNGGEVETAQEMAAHGSIATARLYDRRNEEISLEEVERIRI